MRLTRRDASLRTRFVRITCALLVVLYQFSIPIVPVLGVEYANIDVVGTDNPTTVPSIAQGTPDFFIDSVGNYGDFFIRIGPSRADDVAGGVLLTCVRENGRGGVFATSHVDVSGGGYFIPVHWAPGGGEFNANVAAGYFPFGEGWLAGHARNSANGGPITSLNAGPGINLGTEFIDNGNGQFELYLPGVDSRADGLLLVTGGKNEDNYALSAPSADGTHFRIVNHDNGANGAAYEQDGVAFAYIPFGTPNVTMGRIVGNGAAALSQGDFTVRQTGTGTFQLTIPGEDPTTGALIVSPAGLGGNNVDNIVTYQASAGGWEIQTRDLNANPPPLQNMGTAEAAFEFAFLPLASPPTAPGTPPAVDFDKVAAANVKVTEFNGASNSDLFARVTEGSGGLGIYGNNRGDVMVGRAGSLLSPADGVVLATIREHIRDNSATGGQTGYGMITAWNGYYVSTARAENSGNVEMNIDFACALFPDAAGFSTAQAMPTSGNTDLTIAGAGDTRRSGVLLANVHENQDDFVTVNPKSDGSGWTVTTRDNNGGGASNMRVNYAFLPYGTENLVAGQATQYGNLLNKSGQFNLSREGTGLYRLSIPGESPQTGMLLLTATQVSPSADNTVVYRADGADFLIQGLDEGSTVSANMPQNTDFNFAFIGFNNPPANPQLRTLDPGAVSAANIRVVQNATGNAYTDVSVSTPQTTPGFTVPLANRGDIWVAVDGQRLDPTQGVLVSSVRQNGVDHGMGAGMEYATTASGMSGGDYLLSVFRAPSGAEGNVDVAAAFFPFAGGWQAGHALNSTNGGPITTLHASPGINLGAEFIDNGNGQFQLTIPGVQSMNDGVLLVTGGKNEDNYAQSQANADGSWTIFNHDNGANAWAFEQDPVAFAFVPYGTPGVVSGKITKDSYGAGILNGSGAFSVLDQGTGQVRLTIPGQDPTTGVLIVSPEGGTALNVDNIVTYEADGSGWLIQTRDITGMGLQNLQEGEAMASFAFLPFSSPPTAPGSRTRIDVDGSVSAGNVQVTEFSGGNSGGAMTAVVTESTGQVFVSRANRGDNAIAIDGHTIDPATGVLLATSSEDYRDNSATGGVSGRATMCPFKPGDATAGWTVSTHAADGTNPGEINIDMAVAYFPFAQGWQTAANAPTSGGTTTLTLPGIGDSRGSGVLLLNAYGNDDNFATASPTADGTGWTIQVRDNSSSLEGDGFNYVYLPYGTENLIAGHVAQNGDVMDRTATPFTVTRESAGNYRLSIPGESPQTGMLLLTATQERYSNDNFLTYTADGNDFIIHGIDSQSGVAARPDHDTYFNFAFISFDSPPTDPQLRAAPDPRIAVGAKIKVNDDNYPRAAVIQSSAYIGLNINSATNSGDYAMALDGVPLHQEDGVLMVTAREHIRGSYRGVVSAVGRLTQGSPYNANNDMWIAVHRNVGGAPEHNVHVAAGWFSFAGGWVAGHVSRTGALLAGNRVDQSMFTKLGPGHHELRIPSVDSVAGGILLAVGAGNGDDNVIAAAPFTDGSGWDIVMRDNDHDFANSEGDGNYDAWSFVYVPYNSIGLIAAGRIDDDGSTLNSGGEAPFTVTRDAAGQYTLDIDGWTPADGILLLTESKMGYTSAVGYRAEDNWLTYEDDGLGAFSIQSYDLPNETLQDSEFVFLFLPTIGSHVTMMVPEPASAILLALGAVLLVLLVRRRRRP